MSELKRTPLYDVHVAAGASMVDFGGWEMPIQYPEKIVAEHLFTRANCSLFDVSHMGHIIVSGPDRLKFLQRVLTSNVAALAVGQSQYCIISDDNGHAIDDAYAYRFEEDTYLVVINASNTDKDLAHFNTVIKDYDCTITDITKSHCIIAVQGPGSDKILHVLSGGKEITPAKRNALNTVELEGRTVWAARTGYTGEPMCYELFVKSEEAVSLWNRLVELGAKPAGLGARDTLRMEACLPLYGHEFGESPDGKEFPIFAMPMARFAVSFAEEKGDFIGREALAKQFAAFKAINEGDLSKVEDLPYRTQAIALIDRGVMRGGMELYRGEEHIGWITSGTMVPYHTENGSANRSLGMAYMKSDVKEGDEISVDVRGKRLKARVVKNHMRIEGNFVRPVIHQ